MAVPIEIWKTFVYLAVGFTAYMLFIHDKNNYSEAIAGIFAFIFWIISALSFAIGIDPNYNESNFYQSTGTMWIFVAAGVIMGLLTFVKILDIMTARKKEKNQETNLSPIRL